MDELIILLIKGIYRLMTGPDPKRTSQRTPITPPVPPQFQARPTAPVMAARRPPAPPPRRQGRRPGSTMVAVAAPIVTSTGGEPASPTAGNPAVKSAVVRPVTPAPVEVRQGFTPAALRQQIIMSEILGKPLALRTDR